MELNAFEYDKKRFQEWINSSSYQKRLQERLEVNSACLKDKTSQLLVFQLCREDPIFFIENFGWTYDPRPQHYPHHLPFILFDFQKDVIRWIIKHINEGIDGYLDKSRDMGLTWLFIWVFYWYWRFSESFSGLLGSYKEALVDNRTLDSLFGKLDYALKHTPKWLLPYRFNFDRHRQKLRLINPENQNLIAGDTMNPNFGRGSRKTVIAFDEAASWEYFREAWESSGDATSCRLAFTTPKGRNAAALLKESGIDTYSVHWRLHPLKDEKWYEFQKQRRTDEEIAQELDISYHRSQTGRVYPEWDDVEWGYYPYNPDLLLYVSWDFGLADDCAIVWWQAEGNKVILLDAYSNHGKTIDFYVPFITGVIPSDDYRYTKKDLEVIDEHKNWKKGIHFGDPAGRFRNQVTNKSVIDVLKSYGIVVNFREEAKDFQTRKTETKLLLRDLVVNDNPRTRELGLAMENAHYPSVRRGGQEEVRSIKPTHDWSSHFRSAVEYFAVNYNRLRLRRMQVRDKFPIRQRTNRLVGY